jgi:hypothetical protein
MRMPRCPTCAEFLGLLAVYIKMYMARHLASETISSVFMVNGLESGQ